MLLVAWRYSSRGPVVVDIRDSSEEHYYRRHGSPDDPLPNRAV